MPISTQQTFKSGGRDLLDLLSYCVFSINMDVLFLYLVGEYQLQPRAQCAVALFDVFCSAQAPARVTAVTYLPPRDIRLEKEVAILRASIESNQGQGGSSENETSADGEDTARCNIVKAPLLPPRYLFDVVTRDLVAQSNAKIAALEAEYDPTLTPLENLPGGKLSVGQRAFLDNVWTPLVRPYLVSSGFWRVATVG